MRIAVEDVIGVQFADDEHYHLACVPGDFDADQLIMKDDCENNEIIFCDKCHKRL